ERDQHVRDPERVGPGLRVALEPDRGGPRGRPRDRDVLPSPAAVAPERLDHGLTSREPSRVRLGRASLRVAVGLLLRGEHTGAHGRVPSEGALHPLDLADVDSEAEDLHAARVAAGWPAARILDRDALGEVPRLIDVASAQLGDVVSEEL